MGFLNKMLASVGIGAAKVDTQLEAAAVPIGGSLTGRVVVRGGNVAQTIEHIHLHLMTRVKHDDSYSSAAAVSFPVSGRLDVQPGVTQEVPFRVQVPYEAPLSLPGATLWLQTGAAVSAAVDPSDQDHVQIQPNAPVEALLIGAERAGLRFLRSEVERAPGWGQGVRQELEFAAPYGMGINEVEMVLFPSANSVEVLLEVDRRARGVASLFVSEHESRSRWLVSSDLIARGPDAIARDLLQRLQRH